MQQCHCERCAPLEWERAGLLGRDALPDDDVMVAADAGRVVRSTEEPKSDDRTLELSGRDATLRGHDAYIARLTRTMDEAPPDPDEREDPGEEELIGPDGERLSGRDVYVRRLERQL